MSEANTTTGDGGGSQEPKTFTQEQVDSIVANRVAAERKRADKAENDAKTLRTELDQLKADSSSSKSEVEKLTDRLEAAEKRQVEAERRALISEVAQAKKLSPALAARLQGTSREELESDADELLKHVAPNSGSEGGDGSNGDSGDNSGAGGGNNNTNDDATGSSGGDGSDGRSPQELREGSGGSGNAEPDPSKLADKILSSAF